MQAEVTDLKVNVWYLDDGTLVGPPNALASALQIVEHEGPINFVVCF